MSLIQYIFSVGIFLLLQYDGTVGSTCYDVLTEVRTCPGFLDSSDESYCCGSGTGQYCCTYSTKYGTSDDVNYGLYIGCAVGGFVLLVICCIVCCCLCIRGCCASNNNVTYIGQDGNQTNVVVIQQQQQQPQQSYHNPPPQYHNPHYSSRHTYPPPVEGPDTIYPPPPRKGLRF